MRLILLGPPGSGKGTQAKLLGERLGLVHVSTGDIFRDAVSKGTPTGRQVEPYLREGRLVPDAITNEVIKERFTASDRPERFVLDGYPRTVAQAIAFDQVLDQQSLALGAVVFLVMDDEVVVQRLSGRRNCPQCKATYHLVHKPPRRDGVCDTCGEALIQRLDDQETTVRQRLHHYHRSTEDLVPYYRSRGLLREVPAEGGIEEVYARIIEALDHK